MKKNIRNKSVLKFITMTYCVAIVIVVSAFQGFSKNNPHGNTNNIISNNAVATPIRGKVTDSKGSPLVGVTVQEKNNPSNATVTDIDGNFRITVAGSSSVLSIRYVGYSSIEQTVGNQTNFNISLTETASNLNEVVVVGYGTQKKSNVSAAISTVKGEELAKAPVPNITNSVVGRVAGVIGRQGNGAPGSGGNAILQIRGVQTTGNNNPIIIIDNVRRDNINQVDVNSIESVSILKDAAAVAPYGLQGANGVILITTKQGKVGAPTISLNSWYGIQGPTYYPEVLSAQDYMRLRNEAYSNDVPGGTNFPFAQSLIDTYKDLNASNPDRYPISTPKDIVNFKAPYQSHNVQVSGGSDRIKFYAGLTFFNQKGMFDQVAYTHYNYNMNLEAKVTNTTTFTMSLNGSQEKDDNIDPDNSVYNLLRDTYKYIPTDPYRFSNGLWGASAGLSPLAPLKSGGYSRNYYNTLLSSITLEQKLPVKGLSIKGVVSYDPVNQFQKQYHRPYYYYNVNYATTPYTYTQAISTSEGPNGYTYLFERYDWTKRFTYDGYINYHNTFGKHDLTGLIVATANNSQTNNFRARINNYALNVDEFDFGSSNKNDYTVNGSSGTGSQVGYVYRVSDAYDNGKYILEATGRYDGHYYFAPTKRYAFFPAFSAAWTISREKFMQNITWVNNLKIRGSWGKSGNIASSPFQWQDAYNLGGNAYAFGNGSLVQGTTPTAQANANITWEQAIKTDVALEGVLFNNSLNFEIDYFKQKRTGMLAAPQAGVIPLEYGTNLSQLNANAMEGSGIEITLGTSHRFANGLYLGLNGNLTYATNKLTQVFEAASTYNNPNRRRTGRPNNTQFGYHALGLFQKSDDKNGDGIINAADGYNVTQFGTLHPGDIKYQDQNGDGKIDANDEVVIGKNPVPLLNYGFTLNASWKGFDASAFFQGSTLSSVGTLGFLTEPFQVNNSNAGYEYYNNRWTPSTPNAKYPIANQAPTTNNTQTSDFWVKNDGFLRLKTVTVGYTVPGSIVRALKIKSVRFYVTGQNVLTFSKINWIDPELATGNGANPISEANFPIQKSVIFGLNATF